jgi:hypothetical protein
MNTKKLINIFNSIPETWYSSALAAIETGVATKYYTINLLRWKLPPSDMTILSFLIEANNLQNMKSNFFEDEGVLPKIDITLHAMASDISSHFAIKALNANGIDYNDDTTTSEEKEVVLNNLIIPIFNKIGRESDALKNKQIFWLISRNMQNVEKFHKEEFVQKQIHKNMEIASQAWRILLDFIDTRASVYETTFPSRFNLGAVPDINEILEEILETEAMKIVHINLIGDYPPAEMDSDLAFYLKNCAYNEETGEIGRKAK